MASPICLVFLLFLKYLEHWRRRLRSFGSAPLCVLPGIGVSSVETWFSTALDIEEVLSGAGDVQLHVMVADVIKSFDTVGRSISDCALGGLGHSQIRLRFKLAGTS